MELAKIQISLLEGKSKWSTWKFKIFTLLRNFIGAETIVEGTNTKPAPLRDKATESKVSKYNKEFTEDRRTESSAMIILSTNILKIH